ncbi:MAG: hypothetical protein ACXAE3_17795, partial [Candidatus Kariarchaeaceae archaeon]
MNLKNSHTQIFYVFILMMILNPLSTGMHAVHATPMPQQVSEAPEGFEPTMINQGDFPVYDLDKRIAVIYDTTNDNMTEAAVRVYHSVSQVYSNIDFIEYASMAQLEMMILSDDYFAKLYFTDLTLDGLRIADQVYSWDDFVSIITSETQTHHVFGAGTTDILNSYLHHLNSDLLHIEGSAIIDMELSYFYNLWEVGEILGSVPGEAYQKASESFKILGSQYFADNMESLVNNQIDPTFALGEEDPVARAEAWQNKLDS